MKIFLSHSGSDKEPYVNYITRKLSDNHLFVDCRSFLSGNKSDDEMLAKITQSELYCFFISKHSLPIVKNIKFEIEHIKNEVEKNGKIFIPLIIDEDIKFSDTKIPAWMKRHNLRYVQTPSRALSIIQNKLLELISAKHPFIEQKNKIFIGRNAYVEQFERNYYDLESNYFAFFVSGLEGIGRKSFIKFCLKKVKRLETDVTLHNIVLFRDESIEDFIAKINDLGITQHINLHEISSLSVEEKISLCSALLNSFTGTDDIIIVTDQSCILFDRGLVEWFKLVLEKVDSETTGLRLAISTNKKVLQNCTKAFHLSLPELPPLERERLLLEYLELFKINLKTEEKKTCMNWLDGYPGQVLYLVNYISNSSYQDAFNNSHKVVSYSLDKAETILQDYLQDPDIMQILATLAKSELINRTTFIEACPSPEKFKRLLDEFLLKNICIMEGHSGEYIRLSEVISSYIQRKRYKTNPKILKELKDIILSESNVLETIDDISHKYFIIKDQLGNKQLELDSKYIFPSHIAKIMREMYNERKDDQEVIRYAEYLISRKDTIAREIFEVANYYLCLAYARTKNEKIILSAESLQAGDKNFVLGFYYRKKGLYLKAIDFLEKAIQSQSSPRPRGELVKCYIAIKDMDSAYTYAEENFNNQPSNIYFAQSYLECLLYKHQDTDSNELKIQLNKKMENLLKITISKDNKKDSSMLATMRANYSLIVNKRSDEAYDYITAHEAYFEEDMYTVNTKFRIHQQAFDIDKMKETQDRLKEIIKDKEYMNLLDLNRINIIYSEKGFEAAVKAINLLNENTYSDTFKKRLIHKLEKGHMF